MRILVLDDEWIIRKPLAEFLRKRGFEVRTAGSIKEAILMVNGWQPWLVCSDYHLDKDVTGYDAVDELMDRLGKDSFHTIFMTGRKSKNNLDSSQDVEDRFGAKFIWKGGDHQKKINKTIHDFIGQAVGKCFKTISHKEAMANMELIRKALKKPDDYFELYYQPKFKASDGNLAGMEALFRFPAIKWDPQKKRGWNTENVIHVLETLGYIHEVGLWVLKKACQQTKQWLNKCTHLKVAVNVSPVQLSNLEGFVQALDSIREETDLPVANLELEITESRKKDGPEVNAFIEKCKERGIEVALDDYGEGESRWEDLFNHDFDYVKIDQRYIRKHDLRNIAETIIKMAKEKGCQVVAEGVEDLDCVQFLRDKECHLLQGYHFSKPKSHQDFEAFLSNKQRLEELRQEILHPKPP